MVQIAMDITMHMDVLLIVIVVFFILLIVALLFSDIFRTDLKAIFYMGVQIIVAPIYNIIKIPKFQPVECNFFVRNWFLYA